MNGQATLELAQAAFGVGQYVLGASANKMAIWVQGCSLPKCPGCTSPHTWIPGKGKLVTVDSLISLALIQTLPPTGLVVSGGEPTDQASAVITLLKAFRRTFPEAEIILYTGLSWRALSQRYPDLVSLLDVAVTGPYARTSQPATAMAGSRNQQVTLLTDMATYLYRNLDSWPLHKIQVGICKPGEIVTVGIPDLHSLQRAAQGMGAAIGIKAPDDNRIGEKE